MKFVTEEWSITTTKNNLAEWDAKLNKVVGDGDFFYVLDLTEKLQKKADASGIQNGQMTAQVLHTTCVLSVNELNEPMLLGDICRKMEDEVPKANDYLHNSSMRTVNLCADDHKCDRNADAHLKAFLVGNHTATLLIQNGKLVLGQWQRFCLIDFDGPRTRKLVVQFSGV